MWASVEPDSSTWEPKELRSLKHKLAHLSCKCISRNRSKTPSTMLALRRNDKQVQVQEPNNGSFDQFTQVNPQTMTKDKNLFLNTLTKDILCPTCYVTMNLLRGGMLRVLKDEESETKPEMFCCDKSTVKCVRALEKSTSITNKPVPKFSNLTLCDLLSECSSDLSTPTPTLAHVEKRIPHQVKFLDIEVEKKQKIPFNGACSCLENFMDSIRPPLFNTNYMNY